MAPKLWIIDPAFAIPLKPEELHALGVCAVVWGQIDFILDRILQFAHEFDAEQTKQFLTDKMIGSKVDMLAKAIDRLPPECQPHAAEFIERINKIKQRRNGAFHGLWGWRWEKRSKTRQPAAMHQSMKDNPVCPADLRKLGADMVECSKAGARAHSILLGLEFKAATQFTWGAEGPDGEPEAWLQELTGPLSKGRHPLDRRRQGGGTPPTNGRG